MPRNVQLMLMDKPVLSYDVDCGLYEVLDNKLLPYPLQDRFKKTPKFEEIKNLNDMQIRDLLRCKNHEVFNNWLDYRLLPTGRTYCKRIVLLFGQDPRPNRKLIYLCRALSAIDNYWLKVEGDNVTWNNVNLRTNPISEEVAAVALYGTYAESQKQVLTPELTNQGAYAKAWLHRDDSFWLYKRGYDGITECRIEAMVSDLLDKCNVRHVAYEMAEEPDPNNSEVNPTCVRCKCISTDELMIVPAMDYMSYCNSHDLDFDKECVRIDADLYYKMMIVDYLTANRDRHSMNWGFFADSRTNEIISMHPLFDHNNAFDVNYMDDVNLNYQAVKGKTLREAAMYAMKKVDFYFTEEITRDDFITTRQFEMFMSRAKELGIETRPSVRIDWMRQNAPEALRTAEHEDLVEAMQSSWLKYLRNDCVS